MWLYQYKAQTNPDRYIDSDPNKPKFYYSGQEKQTSNPKKLDNQFYRKIILIGLKKNSRKWLDTSVKIIYSPFFENSNGTPADDGLNLQVPIPVFQKTVGR